MVVEMGTKKGQRRITYGKNGTPTKKAYPSKKKTKKRTKPSGKKGAIFHTYLHTVMVNTLRTLISKAQKSKNIHEAYNIDGIDLDFDSTNGFISSNLAESLTDSDSLDFMTNIELKDILERSNLSQHELDFLELRLEGTPMERISELLDVPAYKIRSSIQRKVVRFLKDNDAKKES